MVHTVSTSCASMVLVCVSSVDSMREIIYKTSELIMNTIIRVWSWKYKSSSIIGEAAS